MKSLAASAKRRGAGAGKYASGRSKLVSIVEPAFVVASTDDLSVDAALGGATTQAEALARVKARAGRRGAGLQVVAKEEAAS
mgnify:CR=1 FL=1